MVRRFPQNTQEGDVEVVALSIESFNRHWKLPDFTLMISRDYDSLENTLNPRVEPDVNFDSIPLDHVCPGGPNPAHRESDWRQDCGTSRSAVSVSQPYLF